MRTRVVLFWNYCYMLLFGGLLQNPLHGRLVSAVKAVLLSFRQTRAECCAETFSVAQTRACRWGDLVEVSQLLSKVRLWWSVQGVNVPPFISVEILQVSYYAVPSWRGTDPLVVAELNAAVWNHPFLCCVLLFSDNILSRETHTSILISTPKSQCCFLLMWHCCLILPCSSSSVALMKCCDASASWLAHCVTAGTATLGHLEREVNSLMVLRRSQITSNAISGQRVAEGQCITVFGLKLQREDFSLQGCGGGTFHW